MKNGAKQEPAQLDLWGGKPEPQFEEYKAAREFVRSLRLASREEWEAYAEAGNLKGTTIPPNPERVYHNRGWNGWNDWLGIPEPDSTGKAIPETLFPDVPSEGLWSPQDGPNWINFHEARRIARDYGFEYEEEWDLLIRGKFPGRKSLPDDIPAQPDRVYRHLGWKGWRDWLVSPEKQVEYSPFHRAREFVRSCRIPDKDAWREFLRDNARMIGDHQFVLPVRPHLEYRDTGWEGWEDWLGTNIPFQDFTSTRKFIRSLKLKSKEEWLDYCQGSLPNKPKKSDRIYTYPDVAFRDQGWKGWGDWLGSPQDTVSGVSSGNNQQPGGDQDTGSASQKTTEIMIECRCKGRIPDCPDCDGKGYYTVQLD